MKAIVHIGMHKTGTNRIQTCLAKTAPKGMYYFGFDANNLNQWCRLMFEDETALRQIGVFSSAEQDELETARKKAHDDTEKALKHCAEDTVILSAERFSYMSLEAAKAFKAWLEEHFDDVSFYAYIRDPIPFVKASFQQRTQGLAKSADFRPDHPKYQQRFEKFEELFGSEKITYRLYRLDELKGKDVAQDFVDWIGGECTAPGVHKEEEDFSVEALSFLVAVANSKARVNLPPRKASTLVNALLKHKGRSWKFSNSAASLLMEKIGEDIAWMNARLPEPLLSSDDIQADVEISEQEDLEKIALQTYAEFRDLAYEILPPKISNLREAAIAMRLLKQI